MNYQHLRINNDQILLTVFILRRKGATNKSLRSVRYQGKLLVAFSGPNIPHLGNQAMHFGVDKI